MMTRALNAAAMLILLAIVGGIGGAAYLIYRLAENTVQTIDRTWGPAFYQIAAGASLLAFVLVTVGGAVVLVQWMARRSRYVHPRDGMFPVRERGDGYDNPNEPGAQSLAVMTAAGRRPTAALAERVIDAHYRQPVAPLPPALPALPEQLGYYPTRVDVYSAPLPRDLALPVGVGGDGRHVALPLRGLGNVVIGGLPNYGKSELLASMAAGLLRQDATGERQQIAVIDMKLVSFGNLPALAALRWPVATEIDEAHQVIAAARSECARRYEVLRDARVRTLEEYQAVTGEPLPYLTVLVDEIADLTQDDDRGRRDRFLASAMEIARKGRAAGVGLVMATQRPSADVLPSSLRNLAGAAVAFRVQRNHDSIAVLGEPGAETLPAVPGRCLVKHSSVVQVQAFYAGLEGGRFDAFVGALPTQPAGAVDGIAVDNWPTTATVAPVVGGCDGSGPVVQRLQPGREPDPQLAAQLRSLHAMGWSKTSLCNATWGYKDGVVWAILDRVLTGDL